MALIVDNSFITSVDVPNDVDVIVVRLALQSLRRVKDTAMIRSDAEMQQNLELIQGMYRALASLKRDIAPLNFTNYLILAEGPVEQIRRLKREIDEYLGVVEAMAAAEAEAERESASRESNVPA